MQRWVGWCVLGACLACGSSGGGDGGGASSGGGTSSTSVTDGEAPTSGPSTPTGGETTADPSGEPTSSGDPATSNGTADPTGETGETGETGGEPVDYPEGVLCPADGSDPRCGPPFDPRDPLTPEELAAAYADGLAAWRFPGERGACEGCHSPDGYDLARVGYADADIVRRALDHVTMDQANTLVAFVHAVRQKYALTELLHPAKYRPLQPAFEAFPQVTDGLLPTDGQAQDERDEAFMRHLVDDLQLLWATGTVDSLARAHQAYDELAGVDLPTLKLGIPFDHLSEDGHWGEEHLSVFEWYPFMASRPLPGEDDAWYAAVDAYLADPSDANLWGYVDAIDARTDCQDDLAHDGDPAYYRRACDWMRLKWKSLQVLTHMLRSESLTYPDPLLGLQGGPVANFETVIHRVPIWEAGDFVRVQPLMRPPETECFATDAHPCTLLPPVVDATVHSDPTYEEARIKQGEVFQQSWFVMSFLHDPALLAVGPGFATFIGDYLESVLLSHYDVHHAFVVAQMAVHKSRAAEWFAAPGFREGTGKIASVRTFSFKQLRDNFSPPPDDDPRRATHARMFANFARMWIFLVEEDLRLSGEIYDRQEVLRAVRFMRTWILELEGAEDPAINALVLAIEGLAPAATELRSQQNRDENPGTGLQPNGDWAEFDAPYAG
ncbi:MAG: hypothetical protein JNL82_05415 [Myxococcales bacterium]|nr:hypothetical protein [Myxococcales bacterium]